MLRLSRLLLPFLLFTLLLAACGVPDAPSISEGSPAPASIPPTGTAEVMTTPVVTTPPDAETTPVTDTTPSTSADASPVAAESASPSPGGAAQNTPAAAVAPQPINLILDPIAAADFTMQSTIAFTTTRERIELLSWSPDGTQLLFQRRSNLWLYTVTTNEQRQLIDNVRTATWSPDGQHIAYILGWNQELGMEDRRVQVLDLATNQSVEIGDTEARGPIASSLVWTPDRGILLATPHEILAYPETTVAAPPVTVFAVPSTVQVTDETRMSLAPDGRHALIASGPLLQRQISFVVDGSIARSITMSDPTDFTWTPDGQRVVFAHDGEFLSIYSAQGDLLATSTPETLKLRPLGWSPDGSYLVYATNGGGTGPYQAYLVHAGGSGSIELAAPFPSSDGISHALWSPNNQHIAYTIGDYTAVGEEPVRATSYLMLATLTHP